MKKAWIPNQVGDDKVLGFPINTFGNDSGCAFGNDKRIKYRDSSISPGMTLQH